MDTLPPSPQPKPGDYEVPKPPGFAPPEGSGDNGGEFDAVCTLKAHSDGKHLCLIKIGEHETGYKEDEVNKPKPGYGDLGKSIVEGVGQEVSGGDGGESGGY